MKDSGKVILERLLHLRDSQNGSTPRYGDAPPLRSELFSADQMEQHGRALAALHKLSSGHAPDALLAQLAENERVLTGVHALLTSAVRVNRRITPAGEWLLDNFYLIEEQIRTTKRHLPKAYSRELPRLAEGPSADLPRVYDIALETISHGDGRVDPESLTGFVAAYQTVTPLNLGELWALPIMLRLALIENLRRVAARIATDRIDRNRADYWADRIIEAAEKDPKNLILVIADMARSDPPMVSSFIAELTRRLQGQGPAFSLPLTWIEQRLSELGLTIQQSVQSENQRQAADQVSMSNSIGSLRSLSAMDWRTFVEELSVVEQALRQDPAGVYGRMEFSTRDRYRHTVEKIARRCPHSEQEIARQAVRLAGETAATMGLDDRGAHVGFYLIDEGLARLEHQTGTRLPVTEAVRRFGGSHALSLYLGAIGLVTMALSCGLTGKARTFELPNWEFGVIFLISLLASSQLALTLVNWAATLLVTPHSLPRMDFSEGIPGEYRALVVVPTMLLSAKGIEDLVEALEVRFLANRDDHLHYGLLTDFRDAPEETLPDDEPLLRLAQTRIEELNAKYPAPRGSIFFLLHRPRRWNPRERIWMGYERKRGKLGELNALLRGGPKDRFSLTVGDSAIFDDVKYVITLDTDTQLPRDTARRLVGAMAHPLNRPAYDETKERVTRGYGILQPRVGVSLPGANRSRYAHLFGSEPGIDPYTRAVSDVYQDLFDEGSFIGKGIYDVDAFERSLKDRCPENRILSHDLLEGCYARSGLLSDLELFEDYPSRYFTDMSRHHRWIRGDWQLVRWLLPRVPDIHGRRQKNPLSMLSQWKLVDNLRRSLVPAALVLLLVLGWTILAAPGLWTLAVAVIVLGPSFTGAVTDLVRKPGETFWRQHLATSLRGASRQFARTAFLLACLPYEAFSNLDAILRSCGRMLITHRRLLEWNLSTSRLARGRTDLAGTYRTMWIVPGVAALTLIYLAISRPGALWVALPILLCWSVAPGLAWWISWPLIPPAIQLSAAQVVFLRKLARKTWAYFETFVGPEDNWLPPDNYQEGPVARLGRRTSPTNMGMALLANLTAYDFGYLSAGQLIERTANAFRTMESLARYHGHFYNWYDTESRMPLPPFYISTVDSGNLAGHLLTLRPGLLAVADRKIVDAQFFEGLADTVEVLGSAAGEAASSELGRMRKDLSPAHRTQPKSVAEARALLGRIVQAAAAIAAHIDDPEALWWAHAFHRQCQAAIDDLRLLAPEHAAEIPTLRQAAEQNDDLDCRQQAEARIALLESLAKQAGDFANMDYSFLFDRSRELLTIGYNLADHRIDPSFYDLLASEARLCSFVTIAQGQLPQENWFALGRLLTAAADKPMLLSWSGSMFEYLMPLIVMPTYENTLLDQTYKAAVARQIEYGRQRGVPWGISESGYNSIDAHLNYQYRAFGVPGMGLKRGLADDLVVAPYASALALMVAPEEACQNLQRLAKEGVEGRYGLYEAIDYTPARLPRGQLNAVVRSFMAHHQGMSLLSFAYLLLDRPMQKRFESDPLFQATTLLLQERVPRAMAFYSQPAELPDVRPTAESLGNQVRVVSTPDTPSPQLQLLSNGRYHVMITNAGGGYSRWNDLAVTRWREDSTCDNWGTFCYIRATASGEFWSAAYQPALRPAERYEAIFSDARAEFRRHDRGIDTHTEIAVSPEDDIELRRVTITNNTRARKTIEVTSYAEVVLAPQPADALHPAFGNLFVETEILRDQQAILATRRPRADDERPPWLCHLMAVHGAPSSAVSFETDRARFIGRGRTVAAPQAMMGPAMLSGTEGPVLDPIVAVRHQVAINPGQTITVDIVTGMAATRDACLALVGKYRDRRLANRVFDLAWTHSQVLLGQINATEADAQLYGQLAGAIVYADAALRADPGVIVKNRRGQSGLWGYAISGDLPIVLLEISDPGNFELVRQVVQAQAYWRLKGLPVDLVIWNEDYSGYRQVLHDQIMALISAGVEGSVANRPGGIFVRRSDQISNEDRVLFQSVARATLSDTRGMLPEQIEGNSTGSAIMPELTPVRPYRPERAVFGVAPRGDLLFFNGLGGFAAGGREYLITTTRASLTPAPWVNVLANPRCGTVVSESGSAYTWTENAHEFRLTPWCDDPVTDACGEAFYLRDEETGAFWSVTPLPRRGASPYITRHGFGYSVFEHTEDGIRSEVWVYVALDAPVKFTMLKMRNESARARRLSATGYVEWVLGDVRSKTAMHVVTEPGVDGTIFARNPYSTEFADRMAFFDADDPMRTVTGDRREFLGRNGTLANPAAMSRSRLSGRLGAALDPCGAIRVPFDLEPGQERQIVFTLGAGMHADDAHDLAARYRGFDAAGTALESVMQYWKQTLGAVTVETPDPSVNVLANGWLLYQALSCRLWGRSGYYQSGGAFGFRDQLQDAMAMVHTQPHLLREQVLLCASRQFREGDVQHWWHPPGGRGVRTRCSDDYLWLPLAACRYASSTGDAAIWREQARFLDGRPLNDEEESYYDLPVLSDESGSLYEHCRRAILRGLRMGQHGLPLMGSGDWNDGMNLVGRQGKGESVWLGFFLYDVLLQFAGVADKQSDPPFAERCRREAEQLRTNIERDAWDGEWYRRAYFDDGTPLGTSIADECQIDSVAQSWSVLSGAGDATRSRTAMQSVDEHLVRRSRGLVQLLDPPFDKGNLNPGYIKGYVPGVRENGGQYTHAAVWAAMAFAQLGDNRRAWELFSLINPVNHGKSAETIATYKVEPYVVAADVYALPPHTGRGGWTWYTGSAGWMYRLIVESLLGIRLEGDTLHLVPRIPAGWGGFNVRYRYRDTTYQIAVVAARGPAKLTVDGMVQQTDAIRLTDDRRPHSVEVQLPAPWRL